MVATLPIYSCSYLVLVMYFNLSDLHLYGKAKLQQFAETLNVEGYEDMSMSMLREAIEEECERFAKEADEAEALFQELKEIFG